jgi:hypothetical protein
MKLRGRVKTVLAHGDYLEIQFGLAAEPSNELRDARLALPNDKDTRAVLMVEREVLVTLEVL